MIYPDFESVLKRFQSKDRSNNTLYSEKYKKSCSVTYKVVSIDDRFSKLALRENYLIRNYSVLDLVQMWENTDQNNSKYGHFVRSAFVLYRGKMQSKKLLKQFLKKMNIANN